MVQKLKKSFSLLFDETSSKKSKYTDITVKRINESSDLREERSLKAKLHRPSPFGHLWAFFDLQMAPVFNNLWSIKRSRPNIFNEKSSRTKLNFKINSSKETKRMNQRLIQ